MEPADVTLYGKSIFADVIRKLKTGRLSWMGSKCNHKCHLKGETEGDFTHTEKRDLKMEKEIGVRGY